MKIEKKNEVYIRIETEPHIARELSEYFTFEVPGFKFMPQYRNRVWDGKIRLFSYATGQIYAGLYPYIVDWCNKNDIQIAGETSRCDSTNYIDLFKSMNWDVQEIDGHDISQILTSFQHTSEKPKLILAKTVKGKGFSFSENNNDWHHKILSKTQHEEALKELNGSK